MIADRKDYLVLRFGVSTVSVCAIQVEGRAVEATWSYIEL